MRPSLLLLDRAPLLDLLTGRAAPTGTAQLVEEAWLRDRCWFSPISLLGTPILAQGVHPARQDAEAARHELLALGLREAAISWETLRESATFEDLQPFSRPWLLLGIAAHLDATLITADPLLLRPLARDIPRLAWHTPLVSQPDHAPA